MTEGGNGSTCTGKSTQTNEDRRPTAEAASWSPHRGPGRDDWIRL